MTTTLRIEPRWTDLDPLGHVNNSTTVSVIAATDGRRCATVRTVQVVLREDRQGTRPWTDT